jgi:hypothetical protein
MASVDMSFINFYDPPPPSAPSSVRIPASRFGADPAPTDDHALNAFDSGPVQFGMMYFASPGLEPDDRVETRAVTNEDTASMNRPESVGGSQVQGIGDQGSYDASPSDAIGPIQG